MNSVPGRTVGEVIVKNILLAGIAFVALVAPAAAADMPLKAPAPVPVDIWTGGYVGANVGYSWATDHTDSIGSPGTCTVVGAGCSTAPVNGISNAMVATATFQDSLKRSGVIYGGQAGHNWLVHNMFWNADGVLGVEVDFQGVSDSHSATVTNGAAIPGLVNTITQSATLSEKINTLGTVRGRAGLLWGPSTLVYVTGGVAFANVTATTSLNQTMLGANVGGTAPYTGAGTTNTELFGPVIGGGIEWKWTANWSVKAEYLYADLGNVVVNTNALINPQLSTGNSFGVATAQTTTHVHENIARVGFNYRFW
jgi:outer membrane immunogenic protein